MNFLQRLWADALALSHEPLFIIGKTDITLLRIGGLAVILIVVWRLEALVRRSIARLAVGRTDPGLHLLRRVSTYLVWIAGILVGLNYLGFELSSFAFLGGAVGVGLGFGLQNILHNFVSGIIILVEKTLKVGDVIELQSGVTGSVAEISLRYTRVTTSDQMDIIVPNSEFISGRVINWTFGEEVRRLHIPFSVAYGTDKEQVRAAGTAAALTLAGTINTESRKPEVHLVKLGDSGLEFELVVWVGINGLRHSRSTQNDYLWALETELRNRDIEMPFPQRDLYIKNPKLTVALEHGPQDRT